MTVTNARTRAEIVAEFNAAITAAGPPPAAPAPAPAPAAPASPAAAPADDVPAEVADDDLCMTEGCNHPGSNHADDDAMGMNVGACDVPGCTCQAFTMADGSQPLVDDSVTDPSGDEDMPAPGAPIAPAAQAAAVAPTTLAADVPADEPCQTQGCGHLASAHADGTSGANTGACSMNGCECSAMTRAGAPGASSPDATAAAAARLVNFIDPAPSASPAPSAGSPTDTSGPGDVAPGDPGLAGEAVGADSPPIENLGAPAPALGPAFHMLMVIEGVETDDFRTIAPGVLTWRPGFLPVMGLDRTSWGHDGAELVGRIESITRDGTQLWADGHFDISDLATEFARKVGSQFLNGVSVDLGATASTVTVTELDDQGWPVGISELITQGKVMGATICPFQAFEGCYIVLGDGTDAPTPIPVQQAVAAGGKRVLAINMLDGEADCEPCARALVASANGLLDTTDDSADYAAPVFPPSSWFSDPGFDRPTPVSVSPEGRIAGHIAQFGVCHIGVDGECITVPMSMRDYADFHQGRVYTAEGTIIPAGVIFAGGDHAPLDYGYRRAMDHYASTSQVNARVTCGHDEFGIWIAGSIDPFLDEMQVHRLRSSALSGDWRPIGAGTELVAVLSVNVPGFPIVQSLVASGEVLALVGAGAAPMMVLRDHRDEPDVMAERFAAYDRALQPIFRANRQAARAKMVELGMTVQQRANAVREEARRRLAAVR